MKTIQELKEDRNFKIRSADAITKAAEKENRLLTDDEEANVRGLLDEADELGGQIEKAETKLSLRAKVDESLARMRTPEPRKTDLWQDRQEQETARATPVVAPVRYGTLRAFPNTADGERAAYTSGMWCRAVLFGDESAKRWCTDHGVEYRALNEGTNTAGGALVPEEMTSTIIRLVNEFGVFRRSAMVMPMGRDVMQIPVRTGGITAAFVGEAATQTESDPTFKNVSLTAKKMRTQTRISAELAEDAIIDLSDFVATEAALGISTLSDTVGFNGAGTGAHGGIQGILWQIEQDATLAAHVNLQPTNMYSEVTIANLNTLMGTLPSYARNGARFYCSRFANEVVFSRLAATAGGNTIQTLAGGFGLSFLGFPIEIVESMDSTTGAITDGTTMIGFGNLAMASVFGERRGIAFSTTDQRYWDTDQIGIKVWTRMDIVNHSIGDTTDAGPFVCLIADAA